MTDKSAEPSGDAGTVGSNGRYRGSDRTVKAG